MAGWKQLLPVLIVGKRSRLSHQPINDVAVVDLVLGTPWQSRHLLQLLASVPNLEVRGINSRLYDLANQPAVDRVVVSFHCNQAARVHSYPNTFGSFIPPLRERLEKFQLFRQFLLTAIVKLFE